MLIVTVLVSGFVGVLLIETLGVAAPFAAGAAAAVLSSAAAGRLGSGAHAGAAASPADGKPGRAALSGADRAVVGFYAALRGLALTLFVFLLPVALVIDRDVTLVLLVSVLACFSLAALFTGRNAGRLIRKRGGLGGQPVALAAGAVLLALLALVGAALVDGNARWVLGAVSAMLGGLASAMARPLCFGALSAEAVAARATETAERLCSAVNVGGVLVAGVVVAAHDDAGWVGIAAGSAAGVLAVTAWASRSWPTSKEGA